MRPSDIVILNIQRELSRFSHPDRIPRSDEDNDAGTNVHLLFNIHNPHLVRFLGVTEDNLHWSVDVDFRDFTRQYFENMIRDLRLGLDKRRDERRREHVVHQIDNHDQIQLIH